MSIWKQSLAFLLAALGCGAGAPLVGPAEAVDAVTVEGVARCPSGKQGVVSLTPLGGAHVQPPLVPAVMDQKGLVFIPHVLPVVVGTRVAFPNSDPVQHNVFSISPAQAFNLGTYAAGTTHYVTFARPGVVEILCNVHPEMGAFVVVLDTPYFAMTDEDGRYRIEDVPPGAYTASAWCESQGSREKEVQITMGTRVDFEMAEAPPGGARSAKR